MSVFMKLAALQLALGFCLSLVGAQDPVSKCEFNVQGNCLKTFWNSNCIGLTTFPCKYKLAHVQCGGKNAPVTMVTADNAVNDKGLNQVSVITITATLGGVTETSVFSRANYDTYSATKEYDKIWKTKTSDKSTPPVMGQWNQDTKTAFYVNGALTISYNLKEDSLKIECAHKSCKAQESIGQTFCGDPKNSYEDENSIYGEIPADRFFGEPHAYALWADYVEFAKQTTKQKDAQCKAAAKMMGRTCYEKGQQMYQCHFLYAMDYPKQYRHCMNKNNVDAFAAYVTCLKIRWGKGPATDEECATLRDVYAACGDVKNSPFKITSLLQAAECKFTTTTKAPRDKPKTTEAPSGGDKEEEYNRW